jgi:hypothetical protein
VTITFSYNVMKDANNLLRGLGSTNNQRPSQVEALYLEYAGSALGQRSAIAFVRSYFRDNDINVSIAIDRISSEWEQVRQPFLSRANRLFDYSRGFPPVRAYLTIDSRCTYSIPRSEFFVSLNSRHPSLIVMHELFHFYTWYALKSHSLIANLSLSQYNDLKEALTVLLNVLFSDLLQGAADSGYPAHASLRHLVRILWDEHHDLIRLLDDPRLIRTIRE